MQRIASTQSTLARADGLTATFKEHLDFETHTQSDEYVGMIFHLAPAVQQRPCCSLKARRVSEII